MCWTTIGLLLSTRCVCIWALMIFSIVGCSSLVLPVYVTSIVFEKLAITPGNFCQYAFLFERLIIFVKVIRGVNEGNRSEQLFVLYLLFVPFFLIFASSSYRIMGSCHWLLTSKGCFRFVDSKFILLHLLKYKSVK